MCGCCYDFLMTPIERRWLGRARARLIGGLRGKTLDVGSGTGVNFGYFSEPSNVVACEPNPDMRRVAETRRPEGLTLIDSGAECIEVSDHLFDHVVVTLVLCTVTDLEASLSEFRRVLKPGGQLHFLEHVRGDGFIGKLNDWCTPLWSRLAGGCHLNRRTIEKIQSMGFQVDQEETVFRLLNTPFVMGRARV